MAEDKRLLVRIPADVYDRIAELAERDFRSVNSQIVFLLVQALKDQAKRGDVQSEDNKRVPVPATV